MEQAQVEFYVFHPEEPFLIIEVGGRLVQFSNGKLSAEADNLTKADLRFFSEQKNARFIVTSDLTDPALRSILSERLTRVVGRMSGAQDIATILNEVQVQLGLMLGASEERKPLTSEEALSALSGIFQPGSEEASEVEDLQRGLSEAREDADAIAEGASGGIEDTPRPEVEPEPQKAEATLSAQPTSGW